VLEPAAEDPALEGAHVDVKGAAIDVESVEIAPDISVTTTHDGKDTTTQIRGSSLLLVGRSLSMGINFLVQVLIVRALTVSDFGVFSYALSIVALGQMVITLGLDRGASRFLSVYDEQEDHDRLLGTIVGISGLILALGTLLIIGIYLFEGIALGSLKSTPNAAPLLLILILLAPIQAYDQLLTGLLTVFASPRSIFFRKYILAPGLRLLVVIFLIVGDAGVLFLAIGYVAAGALGVALYVVILWQVLGRRGTLGKLRKATMRIPGREILVFTIPLVTTDLVYIFMNSTDAILLEHFKGPDSVAAWRVIQPAAGLNQLVMQSFALLFTPVAARMYARRDTNGVKDLYWRTAIWMAVISFPLFAATFSMAGSLTHALYGPRYADSAIYLALLSFGYYFNTALGFNGLTLRIFGVVKFVIVVNLLAVVANIALNLFLIPQYGALGAAIGTTLTLVIHNVLKQAGLRFGTGISIVERAHIRVYAIIAITALGLAVLNAVFKPPFLVQGALAALASVAVFRLNRGSLRLSETFPELGRLPFAHWLFGD
jgi:O-antigen/teichoic acid export membrane protein